MADIQSLADAPGKQREYETIFILDPDTANDGVAKVNERVKSVIEGQGGKVLLADNWGKRRLAYPVAKHQRGIYLYWQYLGTAGLVRELERNLRMLDSVVRYLTVKIDENVDPEARPSQMDDEAYARAAETFEAPDEPEADELAAASNDDLDNDTGDTDDDTDDDVDANASDNEGE
ncbi:MAG: 30S ribosomal protein S6 [Deltaproteobacteria bacterium]|nr:MAG: 30S ribosomal protein S6 [Deltaproteobacteria bacterium]